LTQAAFVVALTPYYQYGSKSLSRSTEWVDKWKRSASWGTNKY